MTREELQKLVNNATTIANDAAGYSQYADGSYVGFVTASIINLGFEKKEVKEALLEDD